MTDVFVGKFFFRKPSAHIVKRLVKTSITPNQCSLVSFLLALLAACFFLAGEWAYLIPGAVILYIGHLFDFVDGDLARAKKLSSPSGKLCDASFDMLKKPLLIYSLAFGYFFFHNDLIILFLATLAMLNLYFIDVGRLIIEKAKNEQSAAASVKGGAVIGWLDIIVVVTFFGTLFNQVFLVLVTIAFIPTIISIKRIISIYKIVRNK